MYVMHDIDSNSLNFKFRNMIEYNIVTCNFDCDMWGVGPLYS